MYKLRGRRKQRAFKHRVPLFNILLMVLFVIVSGVLFYIARLRPTDTTHAMQNPRVLADESKPKSNLKHRLYSDHTEESSFKTADGKSYNWKAHTVEGGDGVVFQHFHKDLSPPTGAEAEQWLKRRCPDFTLNREGSRTGQCHSTDTHVLVRDQTICRATASDEIHATNKSQWAVSETNPLHHDHQYTIVVPAYLRIDTLKKSMVGFANCPELSSYHIVWGNPEKEPPTKELMEYWLSVAKDKSKAKQLHIHVMSVDSLNNRYLDLPGIMTDAIVHVDDDQTTGCKEIALMHTVWRAYPQQLVSPHIRAFSCWGRQFNEGGRIGGRKVDSVTIDSWDSAKSTGFIYWKPIEDPFRGYEAGLTKFAEAHRCFSAAYSYGLLHHTGHNNGKKMVNDNLNGEDIFFQATASFMTGLSPVFIQYMDIRELGATDGQGISTRQKNNHFQNRQQVVKEVTKHLGFPWVSSDIKFMKKDVDPTKPCPVPT